MGLYYTTATKNKQTNKQKIYIYIYKENKEQSEKPGLKLNNQKTKIMASSPITSWQIDGETMETLKLCFLGLRNHCR